MNKRISILLLSGLLVRCADPNHDQISFANAADAPTDESEEALSAWCASKADAEPFASGNGSELYSFKICTRAQLSAVRDYPGNHFKLLADIDLSGGDPFTPFDQVTPWTGHFDGNNRRISNWTATTETSLGFFGKLAGTVTNVHLVNVAISGANEVGGIASILDGGEIIHSSVTGTVSGGQKVGGLVGHMTGGSISRSFAAATVTGSARVGGLVGSAEDSALIDLSAAAGTVTANGTSLDYGAGGLAGDITNSTVDNSYAIASVSVSDSSVDSGAMVGTASSSHFTHSFAAGSVNGGVEHGFSGGTSAVTGCYWDADVTGQTTDGVGATSESTEELFDSATYTGWSTDDWSLQDGRYPVHMDGVVTAIAVTPWNGRARLNNTLQMTATATLPGGTSRDVTSAASWSSDDEAKGTVDETGLLSTTDLGGLRVLAQFSGKSGRTHIGVINRIASLAFTTDSISRPAGMYYWWLPSIVLTFDDGSTTNVGCSCNWFGTNLSCSTSDGSIVRSSGALFEPRSAGTATITATYGDLSAEQEVTVIPKVVLDTWILTRSISLTVGRHYHAKVAAMYSDYSNDIPLAEGVTWELNNPTDSSILTIDEDGYISTYGTGVVVIKANVAVGDYEDTMTTTVTVTSP